MTAPDRFKFGLYVARDEPIANLTAICRQHSAERHEIELVDLRDQKRALADGVMPTPLLMKLSLELVRTIIGTRASSSLCYKLWDCPT